MTDHDRLRRALGDLAGDAPVPPDRVNAARRRAHAMHVRRTALLPVAAAGLAAVVLAGGAAIGGPADLASLSSDDDGPQRPATAASSGVRATTASTEPTPGATPRVRPSTKPTDRPAARPSQTLDVDVDVVPPRPAVGQQVRVRVHVRDGHGVVTSLAVRFGNGHGTKRAVEPKCAPGQGTSRTYVFGTVYEKPGTYTVTALVTTGGCGAQAEQKSESVRVLVQRRPPASNGPQLPKAAIRQVPPPDDSARPASGDPVWVQVAAGDTDGYVSRVVVDWGDGSEPTVVGYPLARCHAGESGYPSSRRSFVLRHDYARVGPFEVRLLVTSVGCDGGSAQHARATTTVKAAPSTTASGKPTR